MRVLICGGRDYCDRKTFFATVGDLVGSQDVVIHGGAKGADHLAAEYCAYFKIAAMVFPADWSKHGKSAGPKRNQLMLDDGKPDLVVAFPGGRGTADMVRRAKKAGVKVVEIGKGDEDK